MLMPTLIRINTLVINHSAGRKVCQLLLSGRSKENDRQKDGDREKGKSLDTALNM